MKSTKFIAVAAFSICLFFTGCNSQKSHQTNESESHQTVKKSTSQNIDLSPHALQGKKIAKRTGCMNCHTTNGKTLVGPSFKNMYGHKTTLKDGSTVIVDSLYVIQSMKHPSAKITAGYSSVMPKYDFLADIQMENIVAYLKALSNGDPSQK